MQIISGLCTNTGPVKKINQDSLSLKSAETGNSTVTMAVICDGLGGLSGGEKASAYVINGLSLWFENKLPELIESSSGILEIRSALDSELSELHCRLNRYSELTGSPVGTTMTSILWISSLGKAVSAHIGDTRIYRIRNDKTEILTNDHSVIADEIRNGNISEEESAEDPRQNQLTKCMGAGLSNVSFDYSIIPYEADCTYLLCSDGFRKKLSAEEISASLKPSEISDSITAEKKLHNLTDICLQRNETDNISSLLVLINGKDDNIIAE